MSHQPSPFVVRTAPSIVVKFFPTSFLLPKLFHFFFFFFFFKNKCKVRIWPFYEHQSSGNFHGGQECLGGRLQMQLTALRGVFIIGSAEPRLLRRLNREWEDPPMIGYTGPIQCLRFYRSITLLRPCYPSPLFYFIALCSD